MNVSSYSIKNPVPAILIFILLTVAGIIAYKNLKIQDFPDIEFPIVTVTASLPGATPSQLETEVTRKLEDSISSVQGIKNIYSTISEGASVTTVEFQLESNVDTAMTDVRDAVSKVRADLPGEMRDPVVSKMTLAGRGMMTYIIQPTPQSGIQPGSEQVSWFVDNILTKRLLGVEGVGQIKRYGGEKRQIIVELKPDRLKSYGLSAADVSRILKQFQLDRPAGRGTIAGQEQTIRLVNTVKSADELSRMTMSLGNGRSVILGDLADIKDTVSEPRSQAYYNGNPVVAFEVMRTKGAGEIDVSDDVDSLVAKVTDQYPDYKFKKIIDNVSPIKENFKGSMHLLYEGAALAIIVVFLFLKDWRATLVAAVALPLSVIPTFLGISLFGYSLNTVTLLALALVVGVLVDDAIVEVENIERHLNMGKKPFRAAMEAADEIGMAVIATTLALVAVFLPTAFMGGIPGKFFKQFGWTAVISVLSSLAVARLLTPMMAAYTLKASKHLDQKPGKLMSAYLKLVDWAVSKRSHRWIVFIAAFVFFAVSLMLSSLLPTGFVPTADRNQTQVTLELPPGSTLSDTTKVTGDTLKAIKSIPEITDVFSSVGGGSSGNGFDAGTAADVRKATLTLVTVPRQERSASITDIDQQLREVLSNIPGAKYTVGQDNSGKLQLLIQSDDAQQLESQAQNIIRQIREIPGIGNISSNAAMVKPEIVIQLNTLKAAQYGLTADQVADTVRIATAGDYDTSVSKLNLPDRQVPILVKLPDWVRSDLNEIKQLYINTSSGPVALGTVADVSLGSGPAEIQHRNRARSVTLSIELGKNSLGDLNKTIMNLPAIKNLPSTVRAGVVGDAEEMQKLFGSFGIAMLIGVLCILAILILLFGDFLQPFTIMSALPLCVGGAVIGLLAANKALSMPSMIGLIMLMGIVSKNSILLIDYVVLGRNKGLDRKTALMDACRLRARPIVMTTIAMVAGMIPLAMGWGADPSFRSPMAVTVIGGLVTSTVLSLVVVPVVYALVDDGKGRLGKVTGKLFRNETDETVELAES